jgi:hypothetical protein
MDDLRAPLERKGARRLHPYRSGQSAGRLAGTINRGFVIDEGRPATTEAQDAGLQGVATCSDQKPRSEGMQ